MGQLVGHCHCSQSTIRNEVNIQNDSCKVLVVSIMFVVKIKKKA